MPAGQMFGFLWFVMLFLAAITSSLAMLQPVIALLEEGLGMTRRSSVIWLSGVTAVGSAVVVYFSRGLVALDTLDFWAGTMLLLILATVQAILYGWVLGSERGEREAHQGAHLRIPRFVQYLLKYVSPLFLLAILGGNAWQSGRSYWQKLIDEPAAGISFAFLLTVSGVVFAVVFVAGRRWRAGKGPGQQEVLP
jgi:SNF family Na+-dependent transporter